MNTFVRNPLKLRPHENIFNVLRGVEVKVKHYEFSNTFSVDVTTNGWSMSLISPEVLQRYGIETQSYKSENMIIINQVDLKQSTSGIIFSNRLYHNTYNGNKNSENSLKVTLYRINSNQFVLGIERVFVNDEEPFKHAVTFYWIFNRAVRGDHGPVTMYKSYLFNNDDHHMLINYSQMKAFEKLTNPPRNIKKKVEQESENTTNSEENNSNQNESDDSEDSEKEVAEGSKNAA